MVFSTYLFNRKIQENALNLPKVNSTKQPNSRLIKKIFQ